MYRYGRKRNLSNKTPKAGFLFRLPRFTARLAADFPGFAAHLQWICEEEKQMAHTEVETPQGAG